LLVVNADLIASANRLSPPPSSFGVDLNPKPYRFGFFLFKRPEGHRQAGEFC
jgi:hypothetical protein